MPSLDLICHFQFISLGGLVFSEGKQRESGSREEGRLCGALRRVEGGEIPVQMWYMTEEFFLLK